MLLIVLFINKLYYQSFLNVLFFVSFVSLALMTETLELHELQKFG